MSRSEDWNQYNGAETVHSISTAESWEGNASLKVNEADYPQPFEILKKSEDDAPTECQVVSYVLDLGGYGITLPNVAFRFQDGDSYLNAQGRMNTSMELVYYDGDRNVLADAGDSSVGQGILDTWTQCRWSFWEDSGELRLRFEYDDGGTWSNPFEGDAVVSDPPINSGGGVGIGARYANDGEKPYYVDNTEVFY